MKYNNTENTIKTLNDAHTALKNGDVYQAEHRFKELLKSEPQNLYALDGMGLIHCQLGDSKKAINFFLEALENCSQPNSYNFDNNLANTDKAVILLHLGIALHSIGNNNDALETLQKAYSIIPNSPEIILNLGQLHFELEQFNEAIGCFKSLVELQPQNASAWLTLGYILSLGGFFKNQINELHPNELPDLLAAQNESNTNRKNNQNQSDFNKTKFNETLTALTNALKLDNSSPDACFYIAETFRNAEMSHESLPYYQRLLQIGKEWPQAVQNYGKALLATQNLADGWDAMEFRFAAEFGTWSTHTLPQWSPQNQNNNPKKTKNILAYAEDSIASEIMFASCLPDLINEVDHCVVECEPSLHSLFKRSFPRATIVANSHENIGPTNNSNNINRESEIEQIANQNIRNNNVWGIELDEQIAFGSLPRFFRQHYDTFPLRKSYLIPDYDKVENWMNRLTSIGNMPKIGILWKGCWTSESPRQSTVPLAELRNIMLKHQGDAAWINLQNGSGQKDFETYNRNVSIRLYRFNEIFQYDLDSIAALLTA
ncbi:MAG: tetratricopeptide repeat protein, partial [Planctomycetaceae bacterium]|nr:tetratricopeptide repeat protein [Planctomycetaceae bacterium]